MKATDNILQKLESFICDNYGPGDRIMTEADLAARFNVGKSTIRENMSVLAALGMITRKTTGTFVTEDITGCLIEPFRMILKMQKNGLANLLDLRSILEVNCFILALDKVTEKEIERLEYLHWKMQNPIYDEEEFVECDYEFHNTIASISGNPVLLELLSSVRRSIMEKMAKTGLNEVADERATTCARHGELIAALREKNRKEGIRVLQAHLDEVYNKLDVERSGIKVDIMAITSGQAANNLSAKNV